jgi:hypothetical protein
VTEDRKKRLWRSFLIALGVGVVLYIAYCVCGMVYITSRFANGLD